jgi:hypothetical protein
LNLVNFLQRFRWIRYFFDFYCHPFTRLGLAFWGIFNRCRPQSFVFCSSIGDRGEKGGVSVALTRCPANEPALEFR